MSENGPSRIESSQHAGHVRDGRLRLVHPRRFTADMRQMAEGPVVVTVEAAGEPRSVRANRYYFGAVVRTIGLALGYADPEEMHEILAMKFRRLPDDPYTGSPRRERTKKMKPAAFARYVEDVITWAEADMGIKIPRPEEWKG